MIIIESPSFSSDVVEVRASKGYVEATETGSSLKDNLSLFKEMVDNDPIISSSFDACVDVATANGWDIVPLKPKYRKKATELKEDWELNKGFDEIIMNSFYCMLYYGATYIEVDGDNEFNVLEASEMTKDYNEKGGKITRFYQNRGSSKEASWAAADVVYIPLRVVGMRIESDKLLSPIAREYAAITLGRNFTTNAFKNAPPKSIYSLLNADQKSRSVFINNLRLAKANPSVDIVANGEVKIISPPVGVPKEFQEALDNIRNSMLAITRIPPMWLSIPNNDLDRGASEAKLYGFETFIRKLQRRFETRVNLHLLARYNLHNKVSFRFNPITFKDERTILENAEKLVNLGVKKAKVAEYLTMRGITLSEEDIEEMMQRNDNDLDPSRVRENKSASNMVSNINQKGVSDDGESKLKEKGMWVRSTQAVDEWFYDQYQEEYINAKST